MTRVPVQIRMPIVLNERVKEFATARKLSHSDALRRLVERGLGGEEGSVIKDQKQVADLTSATMDQAIALTGIDLELRDLRPLIEDLAYRVQATERLVQRAENYSEEVLKVLLEILIVSKLRMNATDPEKYKKLNDYTLRLLPVYQEAAQKTGEKLDRDREKARRAHMARRSMNAAGYRPMEPE